MDKGEKKRSGGGLTQSDRLYTNNMNVFILNVIKFERPTDKLSSESMESCSIVPMMVVNLTDTYYK
jgi:hypothetical protein